MIDNLFDIAGLPRTVSNVFNRMEIAEEELARAGVDCFWELCSTDGFDIAAVWLYRAHARELCERARDSLSLVPATYAEMCLALRDTSLKAPLNEQGRTAYQRAFSRALVLGDQEVPVWLQSAEGREPWPGAADEILDEVRRKAGQEWRKG